MLSKFLLFTLLLLSLINIRADEQELPASDEAPPSESELDVLEDGEKHEFQAEVHRLMDIIINSLYREREVFLRELISNSADALNKIRYLKLVEGVVLPEDELYIQIRYDKDARTLTITDTGVGMTKEELVKNLGVVARSGTTEFVEAAIKGTDPLTLIGQFGVGFYSVYLVADKVTVVSRSEGHDQYIWQSTADRTFSVAKDPRGNTMERGTSIILHLKEDADEFLDESNIENMVGRYSAFITYPISLWSVRRVSKEVPIEEEVKEQPEEEAADLEVSEEEDDDDEDEKPVRTRTVTETVSEWKLLNTAKAIWTRKPSEITEEEYEEFYKSLTKDTQGYLTKIHFTAEGEIAFTSILYIPKEAEYNLYDKFYEKSTALKLYVRKVLISDEFEDFLPKYMNFVKGVVDSDDLPLNVSRETLAQNKVLKVMAKKITRKVLEMLRKLAEGGSEEQEEGEDGEDIEIADTPRDYDTFWKQFGKSIKLGVIDDRANRKQLLPLLRFVTSKSDGKPISLETYVDRMKEEQKHIYYLTGETLDAVENSPFLERLKKHDLEVIFMTDALDEYVVNAVPDFDGNPLMNAAKKDLKIPGVEDNLDELKEEFQPLTSYLEKLYGKKVEKVEVGTRITSSPAVLVTSQYGWTANMERIMRAQTFADAEKYSYMTGKKTMEINPHHVLIRGLLAKVQAAEGDELEADTGLSDLANLVYDAALINSGFAINDSMDFAKRIHRVVSLSLGLDPNAQPEEDVASSAESSSEAEAEAAASDSTSEDDLHLHEDL